MRVSFQRLAAAAGAVLGIIAAAAPASALDKLRTGKAIALPFDFTPLDIGMAKGFFQKHGLELDISSFAGSAKLQQALGADAIDIGLGSGPELAFVAKGNPVLGICAYAGPVNLMMVVRPNAGINSIADLKGKRISVSTVGSLTDWVTRELSRQQGWGNDGIVITPLGTNEAQVAAMRAKETDGLAVDPAGAFELEEKGVGKIMVHYETVAPVFINHVSYATNQLIADHPERIKEFLAAWFDTIAWMKANKNEAVKLAAPIMHTSIEIGARDYDETMPTFSDTGKFEPAALKVLARSFVQMGQLPSEPDMSKLYTEKFLPSIDK
ncbi:MAG TPA: ABC transporter substrate-binding protein [Stellaceae bacterium]|jgi:ABC-type nitrate/sulfonate/bicarbonate transport system substrate-binding protein|nr:ABC transporter substrate-binding protein [Stellaceae bacterium]